VANELTAIMNKIERVVKSDQTNRTALTTVLAQHKKRIFNDGKAADGSQIATYSTNPISISKKNQARNTGKTYFKGGYGEYKSAIGKNPGFVNLRNTDQMMMDYGLVVSGDDYGLGFQNEINYNKSQWMEEKFKKEIFEPSDADLDLHAKTLTAIVESQL
jgi:hypothetical protein